MSGVDASKLADFLVTVALASAGHCYLWGGAAGIDGTGCWDCSGAVNNWVGAQAGQPIPGFPAGTFDGTQHGPSTLGWLAWQGQGVGSIDRSQVRGGDIMCWQTHMGLAISSDEMVSAANPAQGTIRSGIDGFITGEQLVCLRLAGIGPGGITLPIPVIGDASQIDAITRDMARSAQALVWARMRIRNVGRHGVRV